MEQVMSSHHLKISER